jgi:hypothetical protein
MDYQTFFLFDMTGAQPSVQLFPKVSFNETRQLVKEEQVTVGGLFHTYLPGFKGYEWTIPLAFVNSSQRAQINTWWNQQTELVFTINASVSALSPQSAVVRIANQMEPLGESPDARTDLFNGGLTLRLSRGTSIFNGYPFILDDPVLGVLDQTYNLLA